MNLFLLRCCGKLCFSIPYFLLVEKEGEKQEEAIKGCPIQISQRRLRELS